MICPECAREVGTAYTWLWENGPENCLECSRIYYQQFATKLSFTVQGKEWFEVENYQLKICSDDVIEMNVVVAQLEQALLLVKSRLAYKAAHEFPYIAARRMAGLLRPAGDNKHD